MPRLRQIALVARDLEVSLSALVHGLGLELAFRDPTVTVFGLNNGVMCAGAEFIEVIAPQLEKLDTTGYRYLQRKGGVAAGYMMIVHTADADDDVAHMKSKGVRVMWGGVSKDGAYKGFHLHPADFASSATLPSVDSMGGFPDPDRVQMAGWAYAEPPPHGKEPKWLPQAKRTGKYLKLIGCTLQLEKKDPLEVAKRWAELYRIPLVESHPDGGVPAVLFSNAVVRFVKARDGRGDGMQSIDLLVPSRSAALARASTIAGAKTGPDGEVELVGVWWRFREENEVDPRILREGGWIESKPAGKL